MQSLAAQCADQGYCHARAGGMTAYLLDTRLHHLQGYRHASFGMLWIDLEAQQLPRIKELGSTKIPDFIKIAQGFWHACLPARPALLLPYT